MNLCEKHGINKEESYFISSDQAIFWLMEQKREKIAPKLGGASYNRELCNGAFNRELTVSELLKWGGLLRSPQSKEEKAMVVAVLDEIFSILPDKTKIILMLHYLGDFATPAIYANALKAQKVLKEKGKRVILSYKYPKTRVANMLNVDRKTITRHVQKASKIFGDKLINTGFIS